MVGLSENNQICSSFARRNKQNKQKAIKRQISNTKKDLLDDMLFFYRYGAYEWNTGPQAHRFGTDCVFTSMSLHQSLMYHDRRRHISVCTVYIYIVFKATLTGVIATTLLKILG